MYQFKKYGILVKYKGLPVYMGRKIITPWHLVRWWPINWIALPIAYIVYLIKIKPGEGKR